MSTVSVLFPNYNNAPYLKEALDSIFSQSYQDFIIYFVDDCSTDESVQIARSYQDDRLVIIEKEQNSGIVDTMNIALDKIDTKYFIRMDGDDISAPDRFKILIDFMESHPEIGVCSSAIRTFGTQETILTYEVDPEKNRANLIFGHSIGHASSIFRTSVLKDNNVCYKNTFWRLEDYNLFYDLKNLTKTTSIPDQLYLYRRGEYNLNGAIRQKKREEITRFYNMIFEDLRLEIRNDDLKIHLQLAGREAPTFPFSSYRNLIKRLIDVNKKSKLFPMRQFRKSLIEKRDKVIFKLIDKNRVGFVELLPYLFTVPRLFKYCLSNALRKK